MDIEAIEKLIRSRESAVVESYKKQSENVFGGLNLFEIVSEIYHRENMHSDVLQILLSPEGNHDEKYKYLNLFIRFLIKKAPNNIKLEDWSTSVTVSREEGRRDITIKSKNRAIIIENKINNAGDTQNQIPTYYYQIKGKGQKLDAIVYLTLNQGKEPDKSTWKVTEEDKNEIEKILIKIRAFDGTDNDLISGWINPCIDATSDINNQLVLNQYKAILQKLTQSLLDMDYMDKFVALLEEGNNFNTAQAIQNDMRELNKYIGLTFKEHFAVDQRFKPFKGIQMYAKNEFPFFEGYDIAGCRFNSDVKFYNDRCTIDFSVRNNSNHKREIPETVLEIIGLKNKFEWRGHERFVYTINQNIIKSKKEAIDFIEKFLDKLNENKEVIENRLKEFGNKQ